VNPLIEIPGREAEIAFFGLGVVMVVLLLSSGLYLSPFDVADVLVITGFAVVTAMTIWSALNYRQKRLAKMHELERLEQTVREVVQSNG
jgi:hypothetical protein